MAITQAVCNSFKTELLGAVHDFDSGNAQVFKLALYSSAANLSAVLQLTQLLEKFQTQDSM